MLAVGSLALVVSVGAVTDGTTCATLSYRRPTVEPTGQRVVDVDVGSGTANRRHRSGPKLCDDPLPHLGVRTYLSEVEIVKRQAGSSQSIVVAGDAKTADGRL